MIRHRQQAENTLDPGALARVVARALYPEKPRTPQGTRFVDVAGAFALGLVTAYVLGQL